MLCKGLRGPLLYTVFFLHGDVLCKGLKGTSSIHMFLFIWDFSCKGLKGTSSIHMFLFIWDFLCKGLKGTSSVHMFLFIWDFLCKGLRGASPVHMFLLIWDFLCKGLMGISSVHMFFFGNGKVKFQKSTCCETATKLKHWFLWVQLLTLLLKTHAKPAVYKTTLWPRNPVNTGLGYTADIVKAQKCPEFGHGNFSMRNHACNTKLLALPGFAYS